MPRQPPDSDELTADIAAVFEEHDVFQYADGTYECAAGDMDDTYDSAKVVAHLVSVLAIALVNTGYRKG